MKNKTFLPTFPFMRLQARCRDIILFALAAMPFCPMLHADPIGIVDTVGITWCEKQWGCANAGPQIAIDDSNGSVYIVWTYAPHWRFWGTGSGFNAYTPSSGWAFGDTGLEMFPLTPSTEDHGSILLRNSGVVEDVEIVMWSRDFAEWTMRSWWDSDHFEKMPLDTITDPEERLVYPALSPNGSIHLVASNEMYGAFTLCYAKYQLNPFDFTGWQLVGDTLTWGTFCLDASPVGSRVAISYLRQRVFDYPNPSGLKRDQNVFLVVSDDGVNWDWQERRNVTNFAESDPFRPWTDNDILFDSSDNIHLAFSSFEAKINRQYPDSSELNPRMCFIWHWSEEFDSFTVAADGWMRDPWQYEGYGLGPCSQTVGRPHLAVNPSNGYIYLLHERNRPEDVSLFYGYANAEQWVSVSTDNGANWSTGTNITNTPSPDCVRNCMSEVQASLYDVVNDTLHIMYILDKEAGFFQDNQGQATENKVIYQKIPVDLIPTEPLIEQFSIREGPVRCSYRPGDINSNGEANGTDVTYAVNFFKGHGDVPAVDCDCPEIARPFYAAGDVNGNCSFNGVDITFYVAFLKGQQEWLRHCPSCPPDPF
jgi:hypothetical protein